VRKRNLYIIFDGRALTDGPSNAIAYMTYFNKKQAVKGLKLYPDGVLMHMRFNGTQYIEKTVIALGRAYSQLVLEQS
jgi:hypothetical protein